ncbi:MAG: class I SAM-dependent methyltransferase [Nanoarchaeota archaeon]
MVYLQDGWVMIDNAKIMRERDISEKFNDRWFLQMERVIDQWNRDATDTEDGYEVRVERFNYIAPQTMTKLALGYLNPNYSILDVGAGSGLVGKLLIEKGFSVDGIDFSDGMMKLANRRGYNNLIPADIRQLDMLELVEQKHYHHIISVGVYGDFVDAEWVLPLYDVLYSNGVLAIGGEYYNLDGLSKILTDTGFEIKEETDNIGHYTECGFPKKYRYIVGIKQGLRDINS